MVRTDHLLSRHPAAKSLFFLGVRSAVLLNNAAANTELPVVKDRRLTGRDPLVRLGQGHLPAITVNCSEFAIHETRAVPDLGLQLQSRWLAGDPVYRSHSELSPGMVEVAVGVRHVNAVRRLVLLHDIPRATRQADALALADRVDPKAAMFGQGPAGLQLDDLTGPFAEVMPNKLGILDLAKKANALAVLAVAIGQVPLARQPPHFALVQVTDGEPQPAQLFLNERAQEVGLVLDLVRRAFQHANAVAILDLRVVAADEFVEAWVDLVEEQTELDSLVAPNVGTRRAPNTEFLHRGSDHTLVVLALE